MAATSDSSAKRAVQWAINEARSVALDVDVAPETMSAYAGQFEEYTFSLRDKHLYSENSARNGKVDRMRPVTPPLFRIDRESQVEFVRDARGSVSAVRILWNDGWVDTIGRTK